MPEPKALKPGDPCPVCDGEFKPAKVPTDDQRERFEDREIREPFPFGFDTAPARDRERLGALYRCHECGYQTRFPLAAETK